MFQGLDFQSKAQTGVAGSNLAPMPVLESLREGRPGPCGLRYTDLRRAVQAQKEVAFTPSMFN